MAMKLSTVYRAVNLISDSVAILPIDIFQYKDNWKFRQYNNLYYLLNVQPNAYMSAFTMKKLIIQYLLLQGNAYILIRRTGTEITELMLLDAAKMVVSISNGDVVYTYNGGTVIPKDDIIHILNYTSDGITGYSTISYASMCLTGAYAAEEHSNNFFSKGASLSGILRPLPGVTLNSDKAKKAKDSFMASLDSSLGGNSGSIVVLDSGLEYQPITVSPKDAQLLESRQFNIVQIAQYFGVSPTLLFDYTKGTSYSTVEQSNLAFLSQTLQPILEKIEGEMYRKLFTRIDYDFTDLRFDVTNLLRMDATTAASYYSQLFTMGALTVNEIREKINAGYPVVGGNEPMIAVQVQPLKRIIEKPPVPPVPLDNNLKQDSEDNNETNPQE
jgi:HK97 family phage portal protein